MERRESECLSRSVESATTLGLWLAALIDENRRQQGARRILDRRSRDKAQIFRLFQCRSQIEEGQEHKRPTNPSSSQPF